MFQIATDDTASGISFDFWLSLLVCRLNFDVSSEGGPASSYTTADIALRVTGALEPPHHDKVETSTITNDNIFLRHRLFTACFLYHNVRCAFNDHFTPL